MRPLLLRTTAAESADGDFYDLSRLVETVSKNAGSTAAELRDAILDDVHNFTRGAVQSAVLGLVEEFMQ